MHTNIARIFFALMHGSWIKFYTLLSVYFSEQEELEEEKKERTGYGFIKVSCLLHKNERTKFSAISYVVQMNLASSISI